MEEPLCGLFRSNHCRPISSDRFRRKPDVGRESHLHEISEAEIRENSTRINSETIRVKSARRVELGFRIPTCCDNL
ncbi:hypothetical protein TNCV_2423171 [Trichonephila clavipes]|nr:hypothetical protein TNCV_2423171 [Trichonephila clavipes]